MDFFLWIINGVEGKDFEATFGGFFGFKHGLYTETSNGKHKHAVHYLSCENECKNSCLGFASRAVSEAKSSASGDEIIDLNL